MALKVLQMEMEALEELDFEEEEMNGCLLLDVILEHIVVELSSSSNE